MAPFKPCLPACWNDDERMDFLFSAFPARSINDNYAACKSRYLFWSELIVDLFCQCNEPVMVYEDLKKLVRRNDQTPSGLKLVCLKMMEERQIVSRSDFLQEHAQYSWLSWSVNLMVTKPLGWLASKVKQSLQWSDPMQKLENEEFICIKSLQKKCQELLKLLNMSSTTENLQVILLTELRLKAKQIIGDGSSSSVDLMLLYLQKTKQITVENFQEDSATPLPDSVLKDNKVVKFVSDNQEVAPPMSEIERSSVKLLFNRAAVLKEQNELVNEKKEIEKQIRVIVRTKDNRMALPLLRRVKKLEKSIQVKEQTLTSIEGMLDRINQTKSDALLLDTFKNANTALKDMMNNSGLNVDETEKTMMDVADTLDDHNEVTDLLSNFNNVKVDDDELEKEFNDLMEENLDTLLLPELPTFVGAKIEENKVEDAEINNANNTANSASLDLSLGQF